MSTQRRPPIRPISARDIAVGFRRQYLLNVALAASAGKEGDLKEACQMAEDALVSIINAERLCIPLAAGESHD